MLSNASTIVYFSIESRFNIITTDAAHVLDQHRFDNASLDVCKQLLPTWAVEVAAAVTVVSIMAAVGEAIVPSVCFQ